MKADDFRRHDLSDQTWALLEPLLPGRQGVWEALLEQLIVQPDYEWLVIDASHCKVHPHAAGAVGGNQAMSRSKGGSTQRYIWPWMRMVCRSELLSGTLASTLVTPTVRYLWQRATRDKNHPIPFVAQSRCSNHPIHFFAASSNTASVDARRGRTTTVPAILSCHPCLRASKATQMRPRPNGIVLT